jgi:hypothetical protein
MAAKLPLSLVFVALSARPAFAQTSEAPPPTAPAPALAPAPAPAPPAAPAPPPAPALVVPAVQLAVPWSGPTGEGVSIGLEEGGWSGVWGSGLRVHVPFVSSIGGAHQGSFGATVRGLVLTGSNTSTASTPADHFGGRLDLVGRSPVFLNLIRIYGGGGVEVFSAFGQPPCPRAPCPGVTNVSGGGQFGFEFFLHRRFSFYLEVGGHGGVDKGLPGGETVIAGMNVYPFSS